MHYNGFTDKSFIHDVLEDCGDLVNQVGIHLNEFLSVNLGTLELHVFQLSQLSCCLLFQESITDSVSSFGSLLNSFMGKFVVSHDGLHHAGSLNRSVMYLFKRTGEIVFRESILLQKLSFNDIGDFKSQLLILRKRILSDQLHDFVQLDLLMKNFLDLLSEI